MTTRKASPMDYLIYESAAWRAMGPALERGRFTSALDIDRHVFRVARERGIYATQIEVVYVSPKVKTEDVPALYLDRNAPWRTAAEKAEVRP